MELFALLIGLLLLVTIIMPWVNNFRFSTVHSDIARLQRKVRELEAKLSSGKEDVSPQKQEAVLEQKAEVKREKPAPEVIKSTFEAKPAPSVPQTPDVDWVKKAQDSFEKNIATKLPVWIGAISLIFAAFFLVKYSIENSWLGPMARVSLGAGFGIALLVAGQWVGPREKIANAVRIGQALIGAGLVALYVSVYAAIHLYGLLPPMLGFGSMTAITALAVVLSLRHGQPIAVFGLLGGLLTPALIGSDEPNAIAMFGYLFLLFSGMFAVLVRKGWWTLAVAALIGVFCWSAFWFVLVFAASDALVLVVFAMAVTAVVLAVTGKRVAENALSQEEKLPVHGLNFTAIAGGVLTIVWLSLEMTLTVFDWSMLGLLSLALIALAYFKPEIYQKPLLVKLGASLIMFFVWAQDAPLMDAVVVLAGMSAVYVGGGALIMRQVSDPRFWVVMQAVSGVALYVISYFALDLPVVFTGSFGMFWGIVSLILASLTIYQAADIREKYTADATIREHVVAIYALAASAFITLGLAIELPWSYVPLAIAGQIAATAWIYQKTQIDFLKKIMMILLLVFAGMNYEQIGSFAEMALESLLGGGYRSYVSNAPLIEFGVPSVFLSLALWLTMKVNGDDKTVIQLLFGSATVLAIGAAYYLLRGVFHLDEGGAFITSAGFIERGAITITCAGVGIAMIELVKRYDLSFLKLWGYGLVHLAMLRFVYFDLLISNPYWAGSQFVGDMPVLNGVTLTYGACGALAVWAFFHEGLRFKKVYAGLVLVSLFALVSLSVRQYFHGGHMEHGLVSSAELYAYSVAWLVMGIGLLSAGIRFKNKPARMASLAVMILVVLKVFLLDAAELEGLYRVFSFLGLGVSLIGLSTFYTKFVFNNERLRGDA